jgi:hypothetical protein
LNAVRDQLDSMASGHVRFEVPVEAAGSGGVPQPGLAEKARIPRLLAMSGLGNAWPCRLMARSSQAARQGTAGSGYRSTPSLEPLVLCRTLHHFQAISVNERNAILRVLLTAEAFEKANSRELIC